MVVDYVLYFIECCVMCGVSYIIMYINVRIMM